MHDRQLTLGSLFDGSGGFPLGAFLLGVKPVWASEIEPFPIRVTTKHMPEMKHYGDISAINGAEVEAVDIITFGSPCTDMSVAGKRAGLKGNQSVLFYEAIRIIKEMRCATDGKYPRFILWENVPGAFSSNKGEDFKAVLESIVQIIEPDAEVPAPDKNRWPYADVLVGDGWSVAYRTVDAQYFGVAQRRRRIYLVADFGSERAGEVLFEPEGVCRNFTPRFPSRESITGSIKGRAGKPIIVLNDQGGSCMSVSENVTATLRAEEHGHQPIVFEPGVAFRLGGHSDIGISGTIRANMGDNQLAVAVENHPADSRIKISGDGKVQTLSSRMGTGGNNVPLTLKIRSGCEGGGKGALVQKDKSATLSTVNDQSLFVPKAYGICSKDSNAMKSDNPHSGIYKAETARTLDGNGGNPSCNQGGIAVCVQGSMIGREEKNGPQGSGINEDTAFTLNTADRHAVAYSMTTGGFSEVNEEKAATLMAQDFKDPQIVKPVSVYRPKAHSSRMCPIAGFPDWWCDTLETSEPTEEEILWWAEVFETHRKIMGTSTKPKSRNQIVKWLKNPYSDSAAYKMWGNGVALPCVCFTLRGIVLLLQSESR